MNEDATTSYLDPAAARSLAAAFPDLAVLLSLDDATLTARLLLASVEIDAAGPYQGRKFDPQQGREFPRVAYGPPAMPMAHGVPIGIPFSPDTVIWDWDFDNAVALTPQFVKVATLYQAASYSNPAAAERIAAIASGLAGQAIGTGSETYLKPADLIAMGGLSGLCLKASQLLKKYKLRSGRIL